MSCPAQKRTRSSVCSVADDLFSTSLDTPRVLTDLSGCMTEFFYSLFVVESNLSRGGLEFKATVRQIVPEMMIALNGRTLAQEFFRTNSGRLNTSPDALDVARIIMHHCAAFKGAPWANKFLASTAAFRNSSRYTTAALHPAFLCLEPSLHHYRLMACFHHERKPLQIQFVRELLQTLCKTFTELHL